MENYNLTQTGPEVQEILDNATPQSELTTETQRAQLAEQTLQGNIDAEAQARANAISAETQRAQLAEQTLQGNIDAEAQARANAISAETQRAQLAEQTLQTHIDNEALTRENADTLLQTNIGAEETRAKAAEKQNADDIDALEALLPSGVSQSNKLVAQQALEAIIALIPSAASALNQLADKAFVNSSIATNTATFRGTFNLVSDIHLPIDANHETIALNLLTVTPTADNNDYCFVQIPDSAETPAVIASTDRYKFNGTEWDFEYTLNTSGFTTAQWEAINSGITAAILESLTGIPALIPSEATDQNQLADKAYVLTQILLATPSFKGQFTTLTQLQAVTGAKAGDLGIVRTKDTDGHDVFAFYQYKNDQWTYFYSLSYHPQDKPATTGLVGEAPYNGMGRVELPMNWVEGWPNDTWLYYPYNDVVYLMYYWNGLLYAPYNSGTQEGLGLDDNLVVKPLDYNIADIEQFVGERYLPFTESSGVWTITKPDDSTITSTELNNTNIYKINDPTHLGINVLTQAMLNRPNTIYVIQYDYDLNGATITVPENCVLQFEGGSLRNGTLAGNNTCIEVGLTKIFGLDIDLQGTWSILEVYPEWFGAKGDGITDDTDSLQKALSVMPYINTSVIKLRRTYLITRTVYIGAKTTIEGEPSNFYYGNPTILANLNNLYSFALDSDVWDANFENRMALVNQILFTQIRTRYGTSNDCSFSIKNLKIETTNHTFGAIRICNNSKGLFENIEIKSFKLGIDAINMWTCTFNSIYVDSHYIGLRIGADCTSNVFNNVNTCLRTREYITEEDRNYYKQAMPTPNLPGAGLTPESFTEPTAWAFGFGSATLNNCSFERFSAGMIAYRIWLVCNNLYMESLTEFIIAASYGHIVVNNMYGSQEVLYDKYSYLGTNYSSFYLTNCHAGKCYSSLAQNYFNQTAKRPVYVIKGISNYGNDVNGVIGNNDDNVVDYPEFTIVKVNDANAADDAKHLGVSTADAISLEEAIARVNSNGIYRNINTIRLEADCSISAAVPEINKDITIDLNWKTLTISKSFRLNCSKIRFIHGNIVLNNNLIYGVASSQFTEIRFIECTITSQETYFIVRSGVTGSAGLSTRLSIVFAYSSYKINGADAPLYSYFRNEAYAQVWIECKLIINSYAYYLPSQYSASLANLPDSNHIQQQGFSAYATDIKKLGIWDGSKYREYDTAKLGVPRSGAFADKPAATDIYVGFKYFCTDKQTTEGATNGIEIIHKGSDVWVDALGRVVS